MLFFRSSGLVSYFPRGPVLHQAPSSAGVFPPGGAPGAAVDESGTKITAPLPPQQHLPQEFTVFPLKLPRKKISPRLTLKQGSRFPRILQGRCCEPWVLVLTWTCGGNTNHADLQDFSPHQHHDVFIPSLSP